MSADNRRSIECTICGRVDRVEGWPLGAYWCADCAARVEEQIRNDERR